MVTQTLASWGDLMPSQELSLHLALETISLCSTWALVQATVTFLVQHRPPLSCCEVSHSASSEAGSRDDARRAHGSVCIQARFSSVSITSALLPPRVSGVLMGACASRLDLESPWSIASALLPPSHARIWVGAHDAEPSL